MDVKFDLRLMFPAKHIDAVYILNSMMTIFCFNCAQDLWMLGWKD